MLSKVLKASLPIRKERAGINYRLVRVDLYVQLTFPSVGPQVQRLNSTGFLLIHVDGSQHPG